MLTGYELYSSDEFRNELDKCQLFRLKGPKGGHSNDGFELIGIIEVGEVSKLFAFLDELGVRYLTHHQKPEVWCPPPVILNASEVWIEYDHWCECFGYRAYITIRTTDLSVEFQFNSISWYDVTLDDVKRAIKFEQELKLRNILIV